LPFVYSFSLSFLNELSVLAPNLQNSFWAGVISFLLVYLFIWEPAPVYVRGQKILEVIFSFFKPLVKVAPFLLPVYLIILTLLYGCFALAGSAQRVADVFLFLFGLSIGLHLVFSAKSLRTRQEDFLKASYIFGFAFVYILNVVLLSLVLSFMFEHFSFVNFCNSSYQNTADIFSVVFKQLFSAM
jgi:hypothetical protein